MSALDNLPAWADALIAALLVISAATALIGAWGLAKLPDFFMRLHAPTKSTTLGVGGVLIASCVYFSMRGQGVSVHEFLINKSKWFSATIDYSVLPWKFCYNFFAYRLPCLNFTHLP